MHVLIADDDAFFRTFYESKLTETGFSVETAADGKQALEKAKQHIPDLILLDIIMPEKNGFEVLQELSNDPQLQKIPVLVFSSLGQEKDVAKAKELGAVDYVNKGTLDFESLLLKIFTVIKPV